MCESNQDIKQYIIVRKNPKTVTGNPVSSAKLAVMVAHASMAFLTRKITDCLSTKRRKRKFQQVKLILNDDAVTWIEGIFTKVLLEVKTLTALEKVVKQAEEAGLQENVDFFCIRDNCLTELVPDEGKTTCFMAIGFRPMAVDKIKPIVKKLQLFKDKELK